MSLTRTACVTAKSMTEISFGKIDWQRVFSINSEINEKFGGSGFLDMSVYKSIGFWNEALALGFGCPVLQKREALHRVLGLSRLALQPATGMTWNGQQHAVLLMATTHGSYALDTIANEILPLDRVRMDWYGRADWCARRWCPIE